MKDDRLKKEIASLKLKCYVCPDQATGFFKAKPVCTGHYKQLIKKETKKDG